MSAGDDSWISHVAVQCSSLVFILHINNSELSQFAVLPTDHVWSHDHQDTFAGACVCQTFIQTFSFLFLLFLRHYYYYNTTTLNCLIPKSLLCVFSLLNMSQCSWFIDCHTLPDLLDVYLLRTNERNKAGGTLRYLSLHVCLCCCLSVKADSRVSAISILSSPAWPSSSTEAKKSLVWNEEE